MRVPLPGCPTQLELSLHPWGLEECEEQTHPPVLLGLIPDNPDVFEFLDPDGLQLGLGLACALALLIPSND